MSGNPYKASGPAARISAIYIAFAASWIFLSDDLLQWLIPDIAEVTQLQTYKGLVFVLITGSLLYRLVYRLTSSRQHPNVDLQLPVPVASRLFPLLLFVWLCLAIGLSGWSIFTALRDSVMQDTQQSLVTHGTLKARQIASWLKERQDDLIMHAADDESVRDLAAWMYQGHAGLDMSDVQARFQALKNIHGFTGIEVYDKLGRPEYGDNTPAVATEGAAARQAMANNDLVLVDFHRDSAAGPINFGFMVPLRAHGTVIGALYAELDPVPVLYPMIQDWPGNNRTGEAVLLRYKDGRAVYLSPPRTNKSLAEAADELSMAMAKVSNVPAFLNDFHDYRGHPVLGYITPIAHSPWLLLVKEDQAEAYASINRIGIVAALGSMALMAISGFSIWLWWLRRQEHLEHLHKQEKLERETLEARYNTLSKFANDIIIVADSQGRIIQANDRAQEVYGYDMDELVGKHVCELEEDASHAACEQKREILERKEASRFETQHRRKDGSVFPVEISARMITQHQQRFIHMVLRDITERRQIEESQKLASLVYEHSSDAMMVTDLNGIIMSINPAFTALTGYSAEEAIGQPTSLLKSGRQDAAFYRSFWHAIKTHGKWEGEIWNKRKNGEVFPEWLRINAIRRADGTTHRLVALFSDITQKKASEALIWQQANFDLLTGLPNRRMFYDRLDQEMKKSKRSGLPMALMFLDLDRFKEVNDTLGHDMGDLLLKEAAQRLRNCVRSSDTVARLGGDEFTAIMGELVDTSSVERVAQNILHRLTEPFQLGLETGYVSASIGITLFPADAEDVDTLIKNADQAMYAAKHQGRNRFNYFTAAMQATAQARLQLAGELRIALAEGQFVVHYQPIVDLKTGEIRKAEALVRWQHPVHGLLNPGEFLALSEETGLIVEIGDWVFHQAARQAELWRSRYRSDFQIGVNKSAAQFHDEKKKIQPGNSTQWEHAGAALAVEITEALLLDSSPLVAEKIMELRNAGVQIAIDDFGTGYSSLAYLRKFEIDYLKIHESFIHQMAPHGNDMALCEAIIVMAHKLGIKVVAEGVETPIQRDWLVSAGCDYGQGYLFSHPLPAEEFEALLNTRLRA
ncbi:uncharacterized protein NMK_0387 [Novimethylophilus kurashikiensis]|uniref:Diguanylate cyclase n=1 Tax=Novimethylophilus kurashikiensis TaxID=1825523 RepID=A0A2R5F2Q1_9PROT|nr:EAL domain-containing protein [Novimethylophilus kurashikiensis]GBG12852.1 uncharacterized protein NMK_0387 [Novimethylophilus kurashikiensis]